MSRREGEIVPLTGELFERFYGIRSQWLIRGVALMMEDEVKALGGLVFVGDRWVAFTEIPEEARQYRRALIRGGRELQKMMQNCRLPVVAVQDEDEPTSPGFLRHFGFVHDNNVWRFEWQH